MWVLRHQDRAMLVLPLQHRSGWLDVTMLCFGAVLLSTAERSHLQQFFADATNRQEIGSTQHHDFIQI